MKNLLSCLDKIKDNYQKRCIDEDEDDETPNLKRQNKEGKKRKK